jgi:hypothetical protein
MSNFAGAAAVTYVCCARLSPVSRKDFIYWSDDGSVAALRYEQWKITFLRRKPGSINLDNVMEAVTRPAHN